MEDDKHSGNASQIASTVSPAAEAGSGTTSADDGRGGAGSSGGGSGAKPTSENRAPAETQKESYSGSKNVDGKETVAAGGEDVIKEEGSRPAKRPRESAQQPQGVANQLALPKSMVRRIMKLGEDTRNVSNEALIIVSKASELFLEKFAAQAFNHAEKHGRRTIKYQDVSDVRVKDTNLLFLEAVVPP